jgi:hypothetical protein
MSSRSAIPFWISSARSAPACRKISKHLIADNSPTGGSMFRIYRDTRFAKDKTPYKTAASAHFPHRGRKRRPRAGLLHPPGTGRGILRRRHLASRGARCWPRSATPSPTIPQKWKAKSWRINSLKNTAPWKATSWSGPPRAMIPEPSPDRVFENTRTSPPSPQFDEKTACSSRFMEVFVQSCAASAPLMRFLAEALLLALVASIEKPDPDIYPRPLRPSSAASSPPTSGIKVLALLQRASDPPPSGSTP